MRTDFENLPDGAALILYPNENNPLHSKPVKATYQGGYYYCEGSDRMCGPDYYFRDVGDFNEGFEVAS